MPMRHIVRVLHNCVERQVFVKLKKLLILTKSATFHYSKEITLVQYYFI